MNIQLLQQTLIKVIDFSCFFSNFPCSICVNRCKVLFFWEDVCSQMEDDDFH